MTIKKPLKPTPKVIVPDAPKPTPNERKPTLLDAAQGAGLHAGIIDDASAARVGLNSVALGVCACCGNPKSGVCVVCGN
jgi:hypothetical protein